MMEKNELLVIYGGDPASMAYRIAEDAGLAELVGGRKKRIGLKPNLVVSRPASEGATTHPEIAAGLIEYLRRFGFDNLVILEGSWVGDRTADAFSVCGYRKLAKETGVELVDTQKDRSRPFDCRGMRIEICDSARAVDFMINLPVMKGHCQTLLTCALKNNKGIIPDFEKRRFHSLGLHKPIAHLNTVARNDFILVDGICGDPDFEEGGNPVPQGRLFAARDPVLCDAWAALQMGLAVSAVPYIGLAEKLGVGTADPDKAVVRELNRPDDAAASTGGAAGRSHASSPAGGGMVRKLAGYVHEAGACSACYASLIFALSRLSAGELGRIKEKIAVGQAFKGKRGNTGVGACASSFAACCPGCPPSGAAVLEFLRNTVLRN
ncbi:MAG: DUF362 domain-containing protein [Treponema sp.]|jgi:uncharacterized protein (DUF362 family)|nr:DUF362 domain-containing protein [Treponema sp.]